MSALFDPPLDRSTRSLSVRDQTGSFHPSSNAMGQRQCGGQTGSSTATSVQGAIWRALSLSQFNKNDLRRIPLKMMFAAAIISFCAVLSPTLAQEAITSGRSVTLAFANELAAETLKSCRAS
jgi:hypothetical protein